MACLREQFTIKQYLESVCERIYVGCNKMTWLLLILPLCQGNNKELSKASYTQHMLVSLCGGHLNKNKGIIMIHLNLLDIYSVLASWFCLFVFQH